MLRVAIKGVLARKVRLLLTSIAVVLGVGFVSGAYFLTDSMRDSFQDLFTEASEGIDVYVQSVEYKELTEQQATSQPGTITIDLARVGISPETIEQVREVDGIARAAGSIFEIGAVPLDQDGTPISGGGAPSFAANWNPEAEDIGALRITEGEAPEPDEVMLDATTMEKGEFEIGDDVEILVQSGRSREEFTISGIVNFGESNTLNGAAISVFETGRVQELFAMGDRFTALAAQAEPGVSQIAAARNVRAALGPELDVITGEQFTQEQTDAIDDGFLSILQNVILGFAAVAVFVGAFTIFNTFTILVGQRTREFGLLRAIGAGRRQVLGIVALEALVIGVVASTLGILAGYGIASLLRGLLNSFADGSVPGGSFPLETRTIVASYLVGVIVTLVASVVPAWRASSLSPLEALRANPASAGRGWKAPAVGALLLAIGGLLVFQGFSDEDATVTATLSLIGGGFAVAIIGIALLSRLFILPVTRLLAPVFAYGTAGNLAARNVLRNRARSATTASALMIGLALASLVLVFQASLGRTIDDELTRSVGNDVSIYNTTVMSTGTGFVSDDVVEDVRDVDGVQDVTRQYYGGATFGDEFDPEDAETITAVDDEAFTTAGHMRLETTDGDEAPGDGVLVDTDLASDQGWDVGDDVELAFSTDEARTFEVNGIFEPNQNLGAKLVMPVADFLELQPPAVRSPIWVMVGVEDGESPSTVADRIEDDLGDEASFLEIRDNEELRELFDEQLAPILGLVLGMLGLSIVIALFGIGNTMALNVFERTREIGLIRAVGGTRRQVRRMIRAEAILVAVFGAIVGIAVGVLAGRALIAALEDDGFAFALSVGGIVGVLLGGFLAGVLAAILPARRASRMDVLDAIATE